MHRPGRAIVAVFLGLTAVLIPAVGLAADTGLTLTAETATLGPHRTSVVLGGTYTCGPFASGRPDRGVIDLTVQQDRAGGPVTAFGFLEPAVCDGTSQPFEVALTGTGACVSGRVQQPGAGPGMSRATPACSTSRSCPPRSC